MTYIELPIDKELIDSLSNDQKKILQESIKEIESLALNGLRFYLIENITNYDRDVFNKDKVPLEKNDKKCQKIAGVVRDFTFNKFYRLFKIFKRLEEKGILEIDKRLNDDKAFPRGFSPD